MQAVTEADVEQAKKTLQNFFSAMYTWETHYNEEFEKVEDEEDGDVDAAIFARANAELAVLYDTYCIPKKADRRRLYGAVGWPPTYNPKDVIDEVVIDGNKIILYYNPSNVRDERVRFTMKKYKGAWLIHKAEEFYSSENKWSGYIL